MARSAVVCLALLTAAVFFSAAMLKPFSPPLEHIVSRIENRQGFWIGLKGEVTMEFAAEGRHASCRAKFAYQRLDEKIMLRCYSPEDKKLLFIFKTHDRLFELYLPSRGLLLRGDALELEDAANFESRLQPLHFYRALKTVTIPIEQSEIDYWGEKSVSLKIYGRNKSSSYLARRILSTREGEVSQETYYNLKEEPVLTIRRFEYQPVKPKGGAQQLREVFFPRRIEMKSPREKGEMILTFKGLRLTHAFAEDEWQLELPEETRVTSLVGERLA